MKNYIFKKYTLLPIALVLAASSGFSFAKPTSKIIEIAPTLETPSHYSDEKGNFTDVDDPAIWVNSADKSKSLVVTTLKKGGIDVYNLQGELIQFIEPADAPPCKDKTKLCKNKAGRLNNVDVIYDFSLNGKNVDIAVVSDRGLDKLAIYVINSELDLPLQDVTAKTAPLIFTKNQKEINQGKTAYGLATAKTDKAMVFVSQNSETRVAQLALFDSGNGRVSYKNIDNLDFPDNFTLPDKALWTPCADDDDENPHLEGIVVDVENDTVFLAQEDVGVWKVKLSDASNRKFWQLIAKVKTFGTPYSRVWDPKEEEYICTLKSTQDRGFGNQHLVADVEGITIYDGGNGKGYLLVSSQGNNSVALFNREAPYQYINSFTVGDGEIDGVNETDGMMVVNANLNEVFSQGVLVMQDGDNQPAKENASQLSEGRESTNFKYVSWRTVAQALDLPVNTHFKK